MSSRTLLHPETTAIALPATTISQRLLPTISAALLGLTILFAVGFLQGPHAAAHEVAHDTRHALGFPCH